MLLNLPVLCQFEILKRLPPTSIDTSALVCRQLNLVIKKCRTQLPKVRVFIAITNELDLETVTICVYLHPVHYNGSMEGCMKRRVYRELKVKISDLPNFQIHEHFGLFNLDSLLLTSRHRELTPISPDLSTFVTSLISTQPKLRYFSARSLDFKNFKIEQIQTFLKAFENLHRLDTFKFETCHFENFESIYALYSSGILGKTRSFKEVCTTREHSSSNLSSSRIGEFKKINENFFQLLQSEESPLEVLDISSSIAWPYGSFTSFIEAWIRSKTPKLFKCFTVMKNDEFVHIVEELKAHPWKVASPPEKQEPLIFENKFNKNLKLLICVESLLYFSIHTVAVQNNQVEN